jgi:hypothetical protein
MQAGRGLASLHPAAAATLAASQRRQHLLVESPPLPLALALQLLLAVVWSKAFQPSVPAWR